MAIDSRERDVYIANLPASGEERANYLIAVLALSEMFTNICEQLFVGHCDKYKAMAAFSDDCWGLVITRR